jgi:3-isopropylmalate/(R)-2-methylmalate dehydratase large subunit
MPMKNIIEKIWDKHIICHEDGYPAVFAIDFMLMHEVTSAQAFQMIEERGYNVKYPDKILATIDHSIPTSKNRLVIVDDQARKQVDLLRENAKKHNIKLYDFDSQHQGIVHVVGPELGATQPGMTIVCGDSHTATHGAFGALAFGIGSSEVGHVLATGSLLQEKPKTMRVEFKGKFADGVTSKDAIMKLIAEIGIGGGVGYIIEYTGQAIRDMSMEARMTLCNMSIECGARAGLIAPDKTTFDYLKGREYSPKEANWDEAVVRWESFVSDDGCHYDKEITIDLATLTPMITWGINPEQAIGIHETTPNYDELSASHRRVAEKAFQYTGLNPGEAIAGVPIQWAFIGSCTNGRIEDLRAAASILEGKHIAEGVTMYVVPGSEQVLAQAREEGLDEIFTAAGADFRMPGCSMCLAMNDDKVPPGQRCISTSNRNFMGRQGAGSITHLASPYTVAASALKGKICCVADLEVEYEKV